MENQNTLFWNPTTFTVPEEQTMATEDTNNPSPKTNKTSAARFDTLRKAYHDAGSPEARARVIAEDPTTARDGIMLARRMESEVLPWTTRQMRRAEETQVGGAAITLGIAGGLVTAGTLVYQGSKWVWNYFRPV